MTQVFVIVLFLSFISALLVVTPWIAEAGLASHRAAHAYFAGEK